MPNFFLHFGCTPTDMLLQIQIRVLSDDEQSQALLPVVA
jgi:hypothetical protein